jgi:hypothetical protein
MENEVNLNKWFYKFDIKNPKKKAKLKWKSFNKLDSFNLEFEYINFTKSNLVKPNLVPVLDGLYEVNIETRECKPIYWDGIIF